MKIDKKRAIRIITDAAKQYDSYLKDFQFLIVYQEKGVQKYTELGFRDMHFLHLTGVKSRLSAQRFYEACLNGKLAENDIEIDSKGKVEQKLQVLPYLSELLYHNCMIGDFLNSGVMIRADYFVGDTKMILSVGFRYGPGLDIPVTLFRGDIRKMTSPTNKVIAIFRRAYPNQIYDTATYVSQGINIRELDIQDGLVKIAKQSD